MKTKLAAVSLLLLTPLAACGGGSEDEATEAIKANLVDESGSISGNVKLTEDEADCVATGIVDGIGVDKLQEYGILTEDNEVAENPDPKLDEADADSMADTFVGCVDVQELLADEMGPMMDQLDEAAQQCVQDALDEDTIKGILSSTFQGEEPQMGGDLQTKLTECVTAAG